MSESQVLATSRVLKKPALDSAPRSGSPEVRKIVEDVIADIRVRGDAAVREYSEKFDNWAPESFRLSPQQVEEIVSRVPQQVIEDIKFAQSQVRRMAQKQLESLTEFEIETLPGVFLGQKNIPITAVGAYIPGGRYPLLASAHMTIVTAKVAGVERVMAATPPIKGEIPEATVAAMHLAGANFGIGSSREHAVWALMDYGFKVVISSRFGDIFRSNSGKAGLLTIQVEQDIIEKLWTITENDPKAEVSVDLVACEIRCGSVVVPFHIDDYTRWRFLEGLDDIDITLSRADDIAAYIASRPIWMPSIR